MASLVLLSNEAVSQIDTSTIDPAIKRPPVDHKGVDAKKLLEAARPKMQITEATTPEVLSVETVNIGVGRTAQRYEFRYSVTVENSDTATKQYRIRTEISGTIRDTSRQFVIGGGQRIRKTVRFSFNFDGSRIELIGFSSSGQYPVKIIVVDSTDAEHDRVARQIDFSRLSNESPTSATVRQDLRIYRLRIDPQSPYDRGNPTKDWSIKATLRVENTGTDYWDDAASVTVTFSRGRGDRLEPIDGVAGVTKPIPRDIRRGESRNIELRLPRSLATGYYTATARLTSRDDQNPRNNMSRHEFYVRK